MTGTAKTNPLAQSVREEIITKAIIVQQATTLVYTIQRSWESAWAEALFTKPIQIKQNVTLTLVVSHKNNFI